MHAHIFLHIFRKLKHSPMKRNEKGDYHDSEFYFLSGFSYSKCVSLCELFCLVQASIILVIFHWIQWTQAILLLLVATVSLPNSPWHLWSIICLFTFFKGTKVMHRGDFLLSRWVGIFNWNVSLSKQAVNSQLTFLLADGSWRMTTFLFCSSPPVK